MTRLLLLFAAFVSLPTSAHAQEDWRYTGEITFAAADTATTFLYHAAVADDGTLYVISSAATDTTGHNALWKAAPGAATFTLVEDYTAQKDPLAYSARGLATVGNDVLVAVQPNVRVSQVGAIYLYPNGDKAQRRVFSSANGSAGYGTLTYGIAATDGGYVYAGMSYQTSMRIFDYHDATAAGYGNWVPISSDFNFANIEVGGHDGCGLSALRDVAVVPGLDYTTDTAAPFFTSRNATFSGAPDTCTPYGGGIAIWTGGTASAPSDYASQRLSDPGGDLQLSPFITTGITADQRGRLWVSGPDSTRRWVKVFEIAGTFAIEVLELPSSTSESTPDDNGAPFRAPNDVALSPDGARAYVTDLRARRVFVFQDANAVAAAPAEAPGGVVLSPVQPSPARGVARATLHLSAAMHARVAVYDVLGREVAVLHDGVLAAGGQPLVVAAQAWPAGVYVLRVQAGGFVATQSFVHLR